MNVLILYKSPDGVALPHRVTANNHSFIFMEGTTEIDGSDTPVGAYDFVFLHQTLPPNAQESLEEMAERLLGLTGKDNLICITGGGGQEIRLAERAVTALPGINTAEDFLGLPWHLVQSDFQGTAQELKKVLTGAKCELLVSLLLLSQGYLSTFAHYEEEEGEWGPPPIKEALADMGFSKDMRQEHREHIRRVLEQVVSTEKPSSPSWWLEPFGVMSNGQPDPMKGIRFLKSLRMEWSTGESEDLPPSLQRVVLDLLKGKEVASPDLVASAYLEMTKRLGDL